nr:hypothetical protein [Lysobacter enzymogenes]
MRTDSAPLAAAADASAPTPAAAWLRASLRTLKPAPSRSTSSEPLAIAAPCCGVATLEIRSTRRPTSICASK